MKNYIASQQPLNFCQGNFQFLCWRKVDGTTRVLKLWHHKNDLSEIMSFIRLSGITYLKKVHMQKTGSLVH